MASYKVLQDIEADDKFVGPLTLKQFIFAAIAAVSAYMGVFLLTKGVWVLTFPLVPIIIVCAFLAFPWGRDQPTEVWLLAKIYYFFKPRKRIWDQSGMQELVRITAPAKIEEYNSDNLTQTEVKSRLKALADTIDSRGWAVKHAAYPADQNTISPSNDRLLDAETILPTAVNDDIQDMKDIFDESNVAKLDSKLNESSAAYKDEVREKIEDIASLPEDKRNMAENNFWFMDQPEPAKNGLTTFTTRSATDRGPDDVLPDTFRGSELPSVDETKADNILKSKQRQPDQILRNHRSLSPSGNSGNSSRFSAVTDTPSPDTIRRARSDSRTIESLQREGEDEVVVPLH